MARRVVRLPGGRGVSMGASVARDDGRPHRPSGVRGPYDLRRIPGPAGRRYLTGVMKSAAETVRMVRVAGILAWLLVGVPIVVQGPGQPDRFAVWLGGFVAFGGLFVWATARLDAPGPAFRAALLAQVGCVIAMTATQCRGWEGTLLVLVAMQLGLTTSRRTGLSWIVLQTAALGWAIQHHWSLRSAVLLSPPYLGFQVLALLVFEVLRREIHARTELARTNAELLSTRALLEESARLAERLRLAP